MKRRLREVFRTNKASASPYFDIAIMPRPPLTAPHRELECQYVEWRNTHARLP
jgi:RNase P protein component